MIERTEAWRSIHAFSVGRADSDPFVNLFLMVNTLETGGTERQFSVLAKALAKERFQVFPGCIRCSGSFSEGFSAVPEFLLGGSLYGWRSLTARMSLMRHLKSRRIHIAHSFDFYTNLTMIPAARLAGTPVVIGSQRQLGDLMTAAQYRVQAAAFRWCDAVVCNSLASADRLAKQGVSREKLFVIGNAVEDEAFHVPQVALRQFSGAMCVGMVARMNARYKNHAALLRIAARVLGHYPKVYFLLVGDGPLRGELEQEARLLGLRDHVVFLGERTDIRALLASMSISVLTSHSEGLSNALLEAMAAGLPVVGYDVGGNGELITEERGMLVPPGNEVGFAAAIEMLLDSPLTRERMGRAGRTFVRDNFSLSRVLGQYEDLYNDLLERKSPARNSSRMSHSA